MSSIPEVIRVMGASGTLARRDASERAYRDVLAAFPEAPITRGASRIAG